MSNLTVRERFHHVMAGRLPEGGPPVIEWAPWWDQTIRRWEGEGLPAGLDQYAIRRWFGLDMTYQHWFRGFREGATAVGPGVWIRNEADYDALRPYLYPDPVVFEEAVWAQYAAEQERGEAIIWITLEGFFWWPRVLFGIAPHLYAFYDQPRLMHRINQDLVAYMKRCVDSFCQVCVPDFMTFAEDMSYNHGPMIGRELFDEFMAPYYREIVPVLESYGILPFIDSDGQIEPLIPQFQAVGLRGILPLERMAGVDVNRIRRNHPDWCMIGGFDKTVMHQGEACLRAEFERLMPVVRTGCFIPSVDHQTPPGVSLEDYRLYLRLLREYMAR